jgi:hypothetical protein
LFVVVLASLAQAAIIGGALGERSATHQPL